MFSGIEWIVRISFKSINDAKHNGDCFLMIFGSKGETQTLELDDPGSHMVGNLVEYKFFTKDIGVQTEIKLWIEGYSTWQAKKVTKLSFLRFCFVVISLLIIQLN